MSFFFTPSETSDEAPRLRTFWRFAIFGIGFVATNILIALVFFIAVFVHLSATGELAEMTAGNDVTVLAARLEQWVTERLAPLTAMTAIPTTGLAFGLCWICRRYLDRRSISSMGLVRPVQRLSGIVPGFFFGLTPIVIAAGVVGLIGGFRFQSVTFSSDIVYMTPALVLLAFYEEIVFRGYLLQNLFDIRRFVFGFLLTSVAFWLVHGLNPAAWTSPIAGVNLFGAGVMLGLAYQFGGNIWFPTAAHFGWNFGQGVLFNIPVSGMSLKGLIRLKSNDDMAVWLTGGDFGLEGSIVTTVLLIGMIVLLLYGIRSRSFREPALSRE